MGNKTRKTSNLVSDNNIFVDISNDRVGIGSTQPTAKLDVDGRLNVSGISTLADAIRFASSGDDDAIIDIGSRDGTLFLKAGGVTSGKIRLQGHTAYDNIVCNAVAAPGTTELHFADSGATGGKKLETTGYGVSVYGGLNVSGVSTFSDNLTVGTATTGVVARTDGTLNVSGVSTFNNNVHVPDEVYLRFGAANGTDFYISHAFGVNTINTGNNSLQVNCGTFSIKNAADDEQIANFTQNGSVELYHVNSLKLETTGYGVSVYGDARISGILTVGQSSVTIDGTTNEVVVGTGVTIQGNTGIVSATEVAANSLQFSKNNATIVGTSGTAGQFKQIGGAPFYYDGTGWREVMLSNAVPVTQVADTDWDFTTLRAPLNDDGDIELKDVKNNISGVSITRNTSSSGFSAELQSGDAFGGNNGSLTVTDGNLVNGHTQPSNGKWSLVAYPPDNNRNFSGMWTIEGWIKLDSSDRPTQSYLSPVSIFSSFNYALEWVDPIYDTGLGNNAHGSSLASTNIGLGFTSTNDNRAICIGVRTINSTQVVFTFYNANHSDSDTRSHLGTTFNQFDGDGNVGTIANYVNVTDVYDSSWHHIMLFRNSATNVITLHFDGQPIGGVSASEAGTILDGKDSNNNNTHLFVLGTSYIHDVGAGNTYQGYGKCDYDDVRVSIGTDRYNIGVTTNTTFTPPSQLPTSGTTTIIYPTPVSKFGELTLGSTPVWTGTSGVTPSRVGVGTYRLNYATSYSNKTDYIVTTDIMDSTASEVTVGIARSTDHVEFTLKDSSSTFVDDGSLSVSINNKNNYS